MALGAAAYQVSKTIKKSRVMAFADLGMEAIYEFEVEDMPMTVAVDRRCRFTRAGLSCGSRRAAITVQKKIGGKSLRYKVNSM